MTHKHGDLTASNNEVSKILKSEEKKFDMKMNPSKYARRNRWFRTISAFLLGALTTTCILKQDDFKADWKYHTNYNKYSESLVEHFNQSPEEIIKPIANEQTITTFSNFTDQFEIKTDNPFLRKEELKYPFLVHQFNTDFYGKQNNLSSFYEKFVYTLIENNNFQTNDLAGLRRPLSYDSTNTLEQELIEKTVSGIDNEAPYDNPRIAQILKLSKIYDYEIRILEMREFSSEEKEFFRQEISYLDNMKDTIAVRNKIINLVTELPTLNERMKKIGFLKQKRQELDEELNIRLALTHVLMANDYRVRHLGPRFAYAIGDLKAVNTYTKRHSNRRLWQESKIITDTLDCLINKYNEVNELYASFEFKDENMIFEMPIKDAEIKRIGSYDARRTRGAGGLSFPGNHQGIDIFSLDSLDYSVIMGTPVSPAKEGFIYNVGYSESYGNMIIVWHDAMTTTLYAHLQNDEVFKRTKELFNNGDLFVTPDDIIGSVGRSGNIPTNGDPYDYPHLHFEIRKNGTPQDPLLSLNDEPHVRRYFH